MLIRYLKLQMKKKRHDNMVEIVVLEDDSLPYTCFVM